MCFMASSERGLYAFPCQICEHGCHRSLTFGQAVEVADEEKEEKADDEDEVYIDISHSEEVD